MITARYGDSEYRCDFSRTSPLGLSLSFEITLGDTLFSSSMSVVPHEAIEEHYSAVGKTTAGTDVFSTFLGKCHRPKHSFERSRSLRVR